jgi:hypothetical protein
MMNVNELEKLLDSGFIVNGPIISLKKLNESSLEKFIKVFSIKTDLEILKNHNNYNKYIFLLKDAKTGEQKEFITDNQVIIDRVLKQQEYQQEPVGTLVYAYCTALGGESTKERIFYLNKLIESINGFQNWHFKLTERIGTFTVTIEIKSIKELEIEKTILNLQFLLDCLALYYQVGFQIQYYHKSYIHRIDPTISAGPEERMLQPLNQKTVLKIGKIISNTNIQNVAHGINRSYTENWLISRLSILWATFEQTFRTIPESLLSNDEIDDIFKAASNIETLKADPKRLGKLKDILNNPDRIPLIDRNTRLTKSVSDKLDLDTDRIDSMIKKISKLRGKHVHNITTEDNKNEFLEAEKFLRDILTQYMKKEMRT